jgi:hypothetical protein
MFVGAVGGISAENRSDTNKDAGGQQQNVEAEP